MPPAKSATTPPAGPTPAAAVTQQPSTIAISDVFAVVLSARALLDGLSEHGALKREGITLSEWAFMQAMTGGEIRRIGQLGFVLGITPQGSAQLAAALDKAGLINIKPSAEDPRKKDIQLTDAGKTKLAAIEGPIVQLFRIAFKDKPEALKTLKQRFRALVKDLKTEQ